MKEDSILSGKIFKVFIFALLTISVIAVLNGQFGFNSASAALSGSDVDTEAECRWCHCGDPVYVPDQHHLKVDQPIPGTNETYNCFGQCHSMTLVPTPQPHYEFIPFRDCIQCHTASPNPGHHGRTDYTCTECHEMRWVPSINAIVTVLMNWCGGTPMPAYDPPTAVAGTDQEVLAGTTVNLDGSNSYDTELVGYGLSYQWDFGDGTPIVWGRRQAHPYTNIGTYEAKLTVYNYACSTDPCNIGRCGVPCLTGTDSVTVKVRQDITQNILPIASAGPDIVANPGNQIAFDLSGTRDPDGVIEYMYMEFGDGQKVVSPAVNVSHVYDVVGNYTARLTVYDDDGAAATDEVNVSIVNPEICGNGIDDNGDGLTDCQDRTVCGSLPACIETGNCADGKDNDFNGLTDCADTVCTADPVCALPAPPAAPINLIKGTIGKTSVSMSWTDKATNEDGFYVERSNDGGKSWTRAGQIAANVVTYTDSGLTSKKSYSFRAQAFNTGGVSLYSNTLKVTTK